MCENCLRETYIFPGHVGRKHELIATHMRRHCDTFTTLARDGSANGSRRVRDTCDDFAIVLRGVLLHKNFGHVQNFCKPFTTSSRFLREYCEPLRAVHDSFETSSRIELQNSREQSHASEIGAAKFSKFLTW